MTIDEAIKQLESFHSWFALDFSNKDLEAQKLGIEALKRIEDWRRALVCNPDLLLPGETEDRERR